MNFENWEPRTVTKLLELLASVMAVELPALGLGVMALIPGFLDEATFGIVALVAAVGLKMARSYVIRNRTPLIAYLTSATDEERLSPLELDNAMQLINRLTTSGTS